MKFPTKDAFRFVPAGEIPPYDANNPLMRMVRETQRLQLAAERENYYHDSLQFLFPYRDLALYGPAQGPPEISDPVAQNIKTDFQKQNIADFRLADFHLARGFVSAGDWSGVFLKICYRHTPSTLLSQRSGGAPGASIKAWVRVGATVAPALIDLPLNPLTNCYETELWSFDGDNLAALLGPRGQDALRDKLIQAQPNLIKGSLADFEGDQIDKLRDGLNRQRQSWQLLEHSPDHCLHPVRPLPIEIAFNSPSANTWDSNDGKNYRIVFGMLLRGWRSFLGCGISGNPHGGIGFLEFRNLFSNYFFEQRRRDIFGENVVPELGRDLIPGNYDANTFGTNGRPPGQPVTAAKRENFFAVDYMDLHILQPECGIGIHRHRDNQEAFLMLAGHGLMLVGDWCEFPDRERAFELRTLGPGDIALCKTGQLHALYNATDEPCQLFMFGGYD
jgi:mannose-6-phosphate isomerase-like protein (cupin superfamily)